MPLSAEFSVSGDSSVIAHEVGYTDSVALELLSPDGSRTISWSISGTSHSSMTPPTITPAGSPTGATASFAMPADPADGEGRSVVVKCLLTDNSGATAVAYRVVGVPNTNGVIPVAVGEENYRNATHGWTEVINSFVGIAQSEYNLKAFGAVGDGVTDDTDAIEAAIAAGAGSGRPIFGGGSTYGVSGNVQLAADTWLQDITFKQLTPDNDERATLASNGVDNIRLVRVKVDRNGDGTSGTLNYAAGIYITGGEGHYLEDVEVYGDDIGTGLKIWQASNFDVVRLHVHDINYSFESDPGDDSVQGFWFQECENFRVIAPSVHDLGGDYGSGATTEYSRNAFGGCAGFSLIDAHVWNVDQGIDLTGSLGNTNFRIIGGSVRDCLSAGWKFANTCRDGTVTGATAERCDLYGFFCSGTDLDLDIKTGDITFVNCIALDTGGLLGAYVGEDRRPAGFAVEYQGIIVYPPLGIRFINCQAIDRQDTPTMKFGFMNESLAADVVGGRINECIDCVSIGHTSAAFYRFLGATDDGNSGASKTLDFSRVKRHKLTLTAACVLTLTPPVAGTVVTLQLVQDSTGGRVVTFPGSVVGVPVYDRSPSAVTELQFFYDEPSGSPTFSLLGASVPRGAAISWQPNNSFPTYGTLPRIEQIEHFTIVSDMHGITSSTNGTSATFIDEENDGSGRVGIANCRTGTDTTGRSGVRTSATAIRAGGGRHRFRCDARIITLSDGSDTYTVRVGFLDSISGEPTDGCFFRYTHSVNSGEWQAVTRAAGVETSSATDTNVAATTNWTVFEIEINAAATSVAFYINGALVATNTTNIPTGENWFGYGTAIIKSAGNNNREYRLDQMAYSFEPTTPL